MTSTTRTRIVAQPRARRGFLARMLDFRGLARSRRALVRLDDRMLRDIGITRAEAEMEASRPFWDAPLHWHD